MKYNNTTSARLTIIYSLLIFVTACTISRPGIRYKNFRKMVAESPVFGKSFTGFALYDTELREMVYEYQANKYYTPASNTKLFTLYAGLKILGDQVPGLEYFNHGDSLIFLGTGDPSFLHPDINSIDTTYGNKVYDFLKNRSEQLFYAHRPWADQYFGPGWAWDDYNYYYSSEKSVFPVYANVARFQFKKFVSKPLVYPAFFTANIFGFADPAIYPNYVRRNQSDNYFQYRSKNDTLAFTKDVPFLTSPQLVIQLLSDTLKRKVQLYTGKLDTTRFTLYSIPADSMYRRMMRISDNFIAEQVLILCASQLGDTLSSEKVIEYVEENYLAELPDEPIWIDGSGLSRYNLQTPRSMVYLLQKIDDELTDEQIFDMFPNGGVSGTIKEWYGGELKPYVFAKTGTLSGKHCLSGFLITEKGKKLIFSFMHNNYITSSNILKLEMAKILREIYHRY